MKPPSPEGLVMMYPYRPGRVPVVLVHGTASSPARWADIIDPPLINPEDITIPMCVPGADEAIALIRRRHDVWLSTQKHFQKDLMTVLR